MNLIDASNKYESKAMIRKTPIQHTPCNERLPNRIIRTFLADDSPFMLGLLARILAKDDRVILIGSATDGEKAVRSASTLNLDLAVFDLQMPGLDGAEAARILKGLPNPPTIFVVSADDSFQARTRSLALGADAFLVKSMDLPAELHTALKSFFTDDLAAHPNQPSPFCSSRGHETHNWATGAPVMETAH